jgi:hypothetical protein
MFGEFKKVNMCSLINDHSNTSPNSTVLHSLLFNYFRHTFSITFLLNFTRYAILTIY